ncbi:hypothetical protein H0H93_002885, partial [Arthromyces matolae]
PYPRNTTPGPSHIPHLLTPNLTQPHSSSAAPGPSHFSTPNSVQPPSGNAACSTKGPSKLFSFRLITYVFQFVALKPKKDSAASTSTKHPASLPPNSTSASLDLPEALTPQTTLPPVSPPPNPPRPRMILPRLHQPMPAHQAPPQPPPIRPPGLL